MAGIPVYSEAQGLESTVLATSFLTTGFAITYLALQDNMNSVIYDEGVTNAVVAFVLMTYATALITSAIRRNPELGKLCFYFRSIISILAFAVAIALLVVGASDSCHTKEDCSYGHLCGANGYCEKPVTNMWGSTIRSEKLISHGAAYGFSALYTCLFMLGLAELMLLKNFIQALQRDELHMHEGPGDFGQPRTQMGEPPSMSPYGDPPPYGDPGPCGSPGQGGPGPAYY